MMIAEALLQLRPGAKWTLNGETYDGLTWMDENMSQPSREEVLTLAAQLQEDRQRRHYQVERMHKYPHLGEFADAMYWASQGDNSKLDAYYSACEAVKQAYPKPG